MSDDRLVELLGSLRYERLPRAADERVRRRLVEEWDARDAVGRGLLRALLPVAATLMLVLGATVATVTAPGDSRLYGARVAIEDAAATLYPDGPARAAYLLGLYEQRQAEAARLEAAGSAAAAAARAIEQRTLARLEALLAGPPDPETQAGAQPSASPSGSPSPTPSPTPSPSPAPTPTPSPAATSRPLPSSASPAIITTPRPTPAPTKSQSPLPTAKATPTPTFNTADPSPTAGPVLLKGQVKGADGLPAVGACVSLVIERCDTRTGAEGEYTRAAHAKTGQTVTVYAWRTDSTGRIIEKGLASAVVRGTLVELPDIELRPR